MKKVLLFVFLVSLTFSCVHSQTPEDRAQKARNQYEGIKQKIQNGKIRYGGGNGESIESAIDILGTRTSREGVPAEYIWLENKHGKRNMDWKLVSQALTGEGRKMCDKLTIELIKSKVTKSYYFNITPFFGR